MRPRPASATRRRAGTAGLAGITGPVTPAQRRSHGTNPILGRTIGARSRVQILGQPRSPGRQRCLFTLGAQHRRLARGLDLAQRRRQLPNLGLVPDHGQLPIPGLVPGHGRPPALALDRVLVLGQAQVQVRVRGRASVTGLGGALCRRMATGIVSGSTTAPTLGLVGASGTVAVSSATSTTPARADAAAGLLCVGCTRALATLAASVVFRRARTRTGRAHGTVAARGRRAFGPTITAATTARGGPFAATICTAGWRGTFTLIKPFARSGGATSSARRTGGTRVTGPFVGRVRRRRGGP